MPDKNRTERGKHRKPDVPVSKDPDKTDRYPEVQAIVDKFFPKGGK